jgi:FkbM family methyltransferase
LKPRFRTLRERLYRISRQTNVSLDGVRLQAVGDGIPKEVTRLLRRGDYEFAERKLLLSILQADDRVLEVGAGIGALGLVAARVCGAENVLSYEPNPKTIPLIRANHDLNQLYPSVREKAITVNGGTITFFRTDNIISSSLIERDTSVAITVDSDRLSDAINEFRPTILLMDAEGAELELLPAADLSSLRALVIETHAKITGAAPVATLKAMLEAQGLRIVADVNNNILCLRAQ